MSAPSSPPVVDASKVPGRVCGRRLGLSLARWLLPLLLLFAAYFVHAGDLGKWRDDYFQCSIDPDTGSGPWITLPWTIRPEFWRPIHLTLVYTLGTWFWNHDAIRHLITLAAAMLAIVAWYRLYRKSSGSPLAACLGASLFAFFPMGFEVAFWPAAISTALAMAMLAWMLGIALDAPHARRPRVRLLWLAPLSFLTACLNEQPVAGLAPVGLVILAGRPRGGSWRKSLIDAAAATAWAGLGCLAYIVPFFLTRKPDRRGGLDTLASAGDVPAQFIETVREWADLSFGAKAARFVDVGWNQALPVLQANLWLVALVIFAALVWFAAWTTRPSMVAPAAAPLPAGGASGIEGELGTRHASAPWLLAFAPLSVVFMLSPISILEENGVAPRMTYPGAAMLGMVLCVLAGALLRRARRRAPVARGLVALGALTIAVTGAGALLGMQHVQHLRARRDAHLMSELRRLVPEPPQNAVLVPVEVQSGLIFTRDPLFNAHNAGLFGRRYCAQPALRRAYTRRDIFAGGHTMRGDGVLVALPSGYLLLAEVKGGLIGAGPLQARSERIVPFVVTRGGAVRLVSRLYVERHDHNDFFIDFPLAESLARAQVEEPIVFARGPSTQAREPVPAVPTIPLIGWSMAPGAAFAEAGASAPGERRPGASREAMRAVIEPGEVFQSIASVPLAPAAAPRRILVRGGAAKLAPGTTVELRWVVPERGGQVLGSLTLTPELLAAESRWFPVRFNVAPGEIPLTIRLEGRVRGAAAAEVFCTPGFVQDLGAATPAASAPDADETDDIDDGEGP